MKLSTDGQHNHLRRIDDMSDNKITIKSPDELCPKNFTGWFKKKQGQHDFYKKADDPVGITVRRYVLACHKCGGETGSIYQ
jgi:hypothetical protein